MQIHGSCYSLLIIVSLLTLVACNHEKTQPDYDKNTFFSILIDDIPLKVQLALNQNEQAKGLMYRDSLPENHGMLFLFKQPGPRSFWMRDTKIPLDLAYFDTSGRLSEIHALYPYNENPVRSRSHQILIVIETNQGWFRRNNIRIGAQIDLDTLAQAVRKRGYSLADYPLRK